MRAFGVWVAMVVLGCASAPVEKAGVEGFENTCPSLELALDLRACADLPEDYGLAPTSPLEWGPGAHGNDTLWMGRLMCAEGAVPKVKRLGSLGEPPRASQSAPSPLWTGFGEVLDMWEVQCPGEAEARVLYANIYRCGNPCPPSPLKILDAEAALALAAGEDAMGALQAGQISQEVALETMVESGKRAGEVAPGSEAVQSRLGFAYLVSQRFDEARQAYERAAEINPGDPFHLLHLSWVEMEAGNALAYAERVEALVRGTPEDHELYPEALCRYAGVLVGSEEPGAMEQAAMLAEQACSAGFDACCATASGLE